MNPFFKRGRDQGSVPVSERGLSAKHDSKSALRARNLNLLMSTAEIDKHQLAEALEMPIPRTSDLVDATHAVSPEVAQHIESMLELAPGWLDRKHEAPADISDKTKAILRGEAVSALNTLGADEQHDDEPAMYPAAPVTLTAVKPASQRFFVVTGERPVQAELPTEPDTPAAAISAGQPSVESLTAGNTTTQLQAVPLQTTNETQLLSKEATMVTEDAIQANRRRNFEYLTASKGAKAKVARMMGCSAGHITLLLNGGRTFLPDTSKHIEGMLGLPEQWMDKANRPQDVPEAALMAIHHERPIGKPTVAPVKARRGRPSLAEMAQREAERAAAAPAPAAPAAAAPKPVAKAAPRMARTTPAAAPAVPTAAPAANAAPVLDAPAVAAPARSYLRDVAVGASDAPAQVLSPIVEAVVRTISEYAKAGRLTDAVAYRLLGELTGLQT